MGGKRSSGFRRSSVITIIAVALAVVVLAAGAAVFLLRGNRSDSTEAFEPLLGGDESAVIEKLDRLDFEGGYIERYAVTHARGEARAWVYPNGAVFWCERSTDAFSLTLDDFPSADAYRLSDDPRSPLLVLGEGSSAIVQPPLAREDTLLDGTNYIAVNGQNGSAEYDTFGYLTVNCPSGDQPLDWWVYLSPSDLAGNGSTLDWLYDCTVDKFGDANRMTLDGYYYKTPTDYTPTGDDHYYLNPAAYIPAKLAKQTVSRDGQFIAAAMLDLQREHYNDAGYLPTAPQSGWLSRDYGIGAGFYDTRFNTDLAVALLTLGENLGIDEFKAQAFDYAEFLIEHAATRSTEVAGGGILVDDYSHPDGSERTHTSLNHQLAEILFLYRAADATDDASLRSSATDTADRMLAGIAATTGDWIKPDSNLHYARYPDGSFGGVDYPYLTYNDLLALDRYLGGNDALRRLMAAKKEWMDANGVTEYNK